MSASQLIISNLLRNEIDTHKLSMLESLCSFSPTFLEVRMTSLEERGISGDPEISEVELRKREQDKRNRRIRREQKRGFDNELVEASFDARDRPE